jgi:hypothetical protein
MHNDPYHHEKLTTFWITSAVISCRLRTCSNRVLKGIFEPEMDKATRKWRRLHNK